MSNRLERFFRLGKHRDNKGEKMETRFDVVKLDREASAAKKALKAQFVSLESAIKTAFPSGVSRTQAILKLEEAWAWVGKSARVATEERAS